MPNEQAKIPVLNSKKVFHLPSPKSIRQQDNK